MDNLYKTNPKCYALTSNLVTANMESKVTNVTLIILKFVTNSDSKEG